MKKQSQYVVLSKSMTMSVHFHIFDTGKPKHFSASDLKLGGVLAVRIFTVSIH